MANTCPAGGYSPPADTATGTRDHAGIYVGDYAGAVVMPVPMNPPISVVMPVPV